MMSYFNLQLFHVIELKLSWLGIIFEFPSHDLRAWLQSVPMRKDEYISSISREFMFYGNGFGRSESSACNTSVIILLGISGLLL